MMNPAPAFCYRCKRVTETVFIELSSGLVGNCCATCRACRKGRPYIPRHEYEQIRDALPGQGEHENKNRS